MLIFETPYTHFAAHNLRMPLCGPIWRPGVRDMQILRPARALACAKHGSAESFGPVERPVRMIDELEFPNGIRLLSRWQRNDEDAGARLREIFDATAAGEFDKNFAIPAPRDAVHVGGSINLMTLGIMNDLYGMESAEFYKSDPERYVRSTMMTRRLLGMNKLYVSWPVYAFTAEALGQPTMYPDKFPPGSDPDQMLITRENWRDVGTPDFSNGIPMLLDETINCYHRLTGLDPILHLSAPYSLAADTFGQEPLLAALVHEPEFANELLDHLADYVIRPWIDHFFKRFPDGWVEFSDASGSPFFIGPQNCKNMAIRSIKRLIDENPWGRRVYDANYRGDFVAQVKKRDRSRRRRGTVGEDCSESVNLLELTDLKHSVCRDFVIRLDDDRIPVSFYEEYAIKRNVPLFVGIGAGQVDRNSVQFMDLAKQGIRNTSLDYVNAVKNVAHSISENGYGARNPPWPGTVYFEDVSAESSFELVEIIVETALTNGSRCGAPQSPI